MSKPEGGGNKSAQNEKDHKNFLKELEGKLKAEKFTKEQSEEILKSANDMTPGDQVALAKIMTTYADYNEANHKPETKPEAPKSKDPEGSEEFEEFIAFSQAVGKLRSDTKITPLTEDEIEELTPRLKQWIKAGKPTAVDPLEDEEPEKLLRVSRIKEFGKQFLICIISGRETPEGVEQIPTYRRYKLNGKILEDKTMIVSTRPKYTIPFTKPKAMELVKRCMNESETPGFTFKQGGRKITIRNPDNFIGDFDEVIKKASKGEPV